MALTLDSEEECLAQCQSTGRALVSMTTSQGDRPLGTMLLQLFSDICPHTCGNFLKLVKGEAGSGMKNTPIHRIVPKAFIQGGDVVNGTGKGDPKFTIPDETFAVKHDSPGILAMASNGEAHTGATQFYITLNPLPWLDGKRVAFGRVMTTAGLAALKEMEGLVLNNERPVPEVTITDARVLFEPTV